MRRRVIYVFALVAGAAVLGFALMPSPIDSVAYAGRAPRPLTEALAPNELLADARRFPAEGLNVPEELAIDAASRVYAGSTDGRILRWVFEPGNGLGRVETFARTDGRPQGLAFAPDGRLIVADALRGLRAVSPDGRVTTLLGPDDDPGLGALSDVDVASDGAIYFTEERSTRPYPDCYTLDFLEGRPYGRLVRHDPVRGTTEVLVEGLHLPDGVALSRDEDFVLVNEMARERIVRHWLRGPRAGTTDVFVADLPGYPDGLSRDASGIFWVSLLMVGDDFINWLQARPFVKDQLAKLPTALLAGSSAGHNLVVAIDEQGRIVRSLHDPEGRLGGAVTVAEANGPYLYLGSTGDWIARRRLD